MDIEAFNFSLVGGIKGDLLLGIDRRKHFPLTGNTVKAKNNFLF